MADELEQQLADEGLSIEVKRVECLGQCERGPNLRIAPGGCFYHQFTMDDMPKVIAELQRLEQVE
jgi:(2Fe-2S) ferredoxin